MEPSSGVGRFLFDLTRGVAVIDNNVKLESFALHKQEVSTAAGSTTENSGERSTPQLQAVTLRPYQTLRTRKSCDFCYYRKKRCDGDGKNRCR